MKMYEFETQRTNISPRQFYSWVVREFERRTAEKWYWIDSFEDWEAPLMESDIWTRDEICKIKSLERHQFQKDGYTFIMQWFEGHGYCYAMEYIR